jgi:hypothetical protein
MHNSTDCSYMCLFDTSVILGFFKDMSSIRIVAKGYIKKKKTYDLAIVM